MHCYFSAVSELFKLNNTAKKPRCRTVVNKLVMYTVTLFDCTFFFISNVKMADTCIEIRTISRHYFPFGLQTTETTSKIL